MFRIVLAALVAAVLLNGCVELDGQRISIRYDEAKDELHVLLFHDGIHDSGGSDHGKGIEQIPEFVRNGDFLIMDWPLHFDFGQLRKNLVEKEMGRAERLLAKAILESVKSVPLGHYRDPEGRIGAAQLVVISNATDLFRHINATLNEAILVHDEETEIDRTLAKMKAGAKKGQQWVRIDGHSFVMEVPVHLPEWQRLKGSFARDVAREIEKDDKKEEEADMTLFQALSLTPMSIIETKEKLTLRLGSKSTPSTFRIRLRETKDKSLDEVLVKAVPDNLDDALAAAMLGDDGGGEVWLSSILDWGPPEEQVRALLNRIGAAKEAEEKSPAISKLVAFGKRWNRDVGLPEAPSPMDNHKRWIKAWKKWYGKVLRFPDGK